MTDLLIRSVVASALGLLGLLLARRAAASIRHLVSVAGLLVTLAVTLLGTFVPPIRLPILPAAPPMAVQSSTSVVVRPAAFHPTPIVEPMTVELPRPFPWPAIWATVSLLLSLRWFTAWLLLARRLRRASPVQGLDAPVPVLESGICRAPLTAWIGHAVIVLPLGWREWPAERLSIVLRHELAHVRRGDGWALLLARLTVVAAWPNPLVWWLARESSRLAERATDDLVICEGVAPWRYAETLFAIAQACPATKLLPALNMARKAEVAHRLHMILESKSPRTPVSRRARWGAAMAALALAVPVATWALGRQAGFASNHPTVTVEPTAVANPIAFRLRCKIVRADPAARPVASGLSVEPQIGQSDPSRVVAAPDLYTGNGIPVALKVTLGGTEHTVEMRATTGDDLKSTVEIYQSMPFKGTRMDYAPMWARTRPNGWLSYPITAFDGKPTGYQMLVQVMPYKDGASAPMVPARLAEQYLLKCKFMKSDALKGVPIGRFDQEPFAGQPGSFQVLATPQIAMRSDQPASIKLRNGDRALEVMAQIMGSGDRPRTVMLDGTIAGPGETKQRLNVFAPLRKNQWLRVPFRDSDRKFHGYQLLVHLVGLKPD